MKRGRKIKGVFLIEEKIGKKNFIVFLSKNVIILDKWSGYRQR